MTARPPYCDPAMRAKLRAELAADLAAGRGFVIVIPYLLDALDFMALELERATAYAVAVDAMGMGDPKSHEWAVRQVVERGYRAGIEAAAQEVAQAVAQATHDNHSVMTLVSVSRLANEVRALADKGPCRS